MNIVYAWIVNSVNRLVKNPKHDSNSPPYLNLTCTYLHHNQLIKNDEIIQSASLMPDACDVDGKMLGLDDNMIAVVCSQN